MSRAIEKTWAPRQRPAFLYWRGTTGKSGVSSETRTCFPSNYLVRQLPSLCDISPNKYDVCNSDIRDVSDRNSHFSLQFRGTHHPGDLGVSGAIWL